MRRFSEDLDKVLMEHFDITDRQTRQDVMSLNEAEMQSKVLSALTSKLYDAIIDKVDDIDFGSIPDSKGDISQMENYDKLIGSLDLMKSILVEYKQKSESVDVILDAINNIYSRKDMFEKAFKYNIELPMVSYCTMALSCVSSTSLMISASIEFIKEPNSEDFEIELDKVGLLKTQQSLLYKSLIKFNNSCKDGSYDKSMEYIIGNKIKKLTGVDDIAIVLGIGVLTGIVMNIIPLLRELVYMHYKTRVRVSDYFDIQSDLLRMNAYKVKDNNNIKKEDREATFKKQIKIADLFKKIANKIAIDNKKSEIEASKELSNSAKKIKSSDLHEKDEVDGSISSLF